jgi:ABC-type Fe3+-hydroxamate transport system substrate-binding protein
MKKKFTDNLDRQVVIDFPPKRIISTVPSQTELLSDLGLDNEVVGITRFCTYPTDWKKRKTIIGGTKRLDFNKISSLNPDLIIGNKEENIKPQVEEIASKFSYWISDVNSFEDNQKLIKDIGAICGKKLEAEVLCSRISDVCKNVSKVQKTPKRVAYFIWRNPFMVAGNNTYINSLLSKLGFVNVFKQLEGRYPVITFKDLENANVDEIFLSSIPFPFNAIHAQEFEMHFPDKKITFVDGEVFSYYGSRIAKSESYLLSLLK